MTDTKTTKASVRSKDGVSIAYEHHGEEDPALVFVHGWSCDRSYWKHQIEPFSRESAVIAIDLGGHGESGVHRRAWTIEAFGDDVAAVVEELDLLECILIGHSMGGDVIVDAAEKLGSRVAGLVWVDVYRSLGDPRSESEIQEILEPLRRDFVGATEKLVREVLTSGSDPELVSWIAADMASAPPDVAIPSLEAAARFEPVVIESLPRLELPMTAINAGFKPSDVETLEGFGIQVRELPGVSHFLMIEDPDRFNQTLSAVIAEMKRAQTHDLSGGGSRTSTRRT